MGGGAEGVRAAAARSVTRPWVLVAVSAAANRMSWLSRLRKTSSTDGASHDLIGGVGFGALHVEAADGVEDLQPGGDEQRRSEHPAQPHPEPGESGEYGDGQQCVDADAECEPGRMRAAIDPAGRPRRPCRSAASSAAFRCSTAAASDAASKSPRPARTARSMSWRRKKLPGYSGSRQIARIEERSASTQNRPATR